jgi:type I restriction enzyme M protein
MPLTPDMRRSIDQIRDYLYGGGYPDPVNNAEQLSFLFFFYLVEGIDAENKLRARVLKKTYTSLFDGEWELKNPLNAPTAGAKTVARNQFRWSVWAKALSGEALVRFVRDEVFAFFAELGQGGANDFMRSARLSIDDPTVLTQVITLVDGLRLDAADSDTKGDLFEHVLRQIRQAGELGQFRTPRHVIRTIVEMVNPKVGETIYDPAAGTAGFLVAAYNHIRLSNSSSAAIAETDIDGKLQRRGLGDRLSASHVAALQSSTFFGNDVDPKMVRLATMNLTLRGLPDVNILLRNVLTSTLDSQSRAEHGLPRDGYNVILANPPFSGRVDKDRIVDDVRVGATTATELLFLKYMMDSLCVGGRCGVIVPEGVLRGTSQSHIELRRQLLAEYVVDAVVALPHAAFKPYASVATFILLFRRGGSTQKVWMAQIDNDGYSPDSLREPIEDDDIPEMLSSWFQSSKKNYVPVEGKHGWVDLNKIKTNDLCLIPKLYLRRENVNHRYPMVKLGDICTITKGRSSATKTVAGKYPLVATAESWKSADTWDFEGPATIVPLVSSTGHGHASIKWIHYVEGQFAAATIVAVIKVINPKAVNPKYLHYLLASGKDELFVPLMSGAANVSLSVDKISQVKVPLPTTLLEQEKLIMEIERSQKLIEELSKKLISLKADVEQELNAFRESLINE